MKRHSARSITAAAGICLGVAFGVTTGGAQPAGQGREDAGGQVTVTGCLIEFADAKTPGSSSARNSATAGGAQFVLANVRSGSTSGSAIGAPGTDTPGSAGVSGTAGSGETPRTAPAGARPQPGAAGATDGATRYLVVGLQTDEFRKHVKHQVEISGTLEPRGSSTSDPAPRSEKEPEGAVSSGAGAAPAGGGTSSSGATSGTGGVAGSSGAASTRSTVKTAPVVQDDPSSGMSARRSNPTDLARLRATSIRMVAGTCASPGSPE